MLKFINIGRLGRSFAKSGQIRLILEQQFVDEIGSLNHIFLWQFGQYIPYFIESIEDQVDMLIKFEDVNDIESANKLANLNCFASDRQVDFNKYKTRSVVENNDIVGFKIIDQNTGQVHTISQVRAYPSQTMIVIKDSGQKNEVLIPFVEQWLEDIDVIGKKIFMNLPNGLLTLDEEE
jgi:16S rRNA processing protein RimM